MQPSQLTNHILPIRVSNTKQKEKIMPVVPVSGSRKRKTPRNAKQMQPKLAHDPVVALWNEFQETERKAMVAPAGKEHDELANKSIMLEDRFFEASATSVQGLTLQSKHLAKLMEDSDVPEHFWVWLKIIARGLASLQPEVVAQSDPDPVVALWQEYQTAIKARDEAHIYEEAYDTLPPDERRLHMEQHPELENECFSKEYYSAIKRMDDLEEKLLSAVATTPEGIKAQFKFLQTLIERDWDNFGPLFPSLEAGLNNLHPKAVIASVAQPDPVIALWEKERAAVAVFNAADEENDKEHHEQAENKYLDAWCEFIETPATTLEGLLLQAEDLNKAEIERLDVIVAGIRNIMAAQQTT